MEIQELEINKIKEEALIRDKILRDYLAIDRTKLANQRTILSMIRTSLYFAFTGLSLLGLEWLKDFKPIAWIFFTISGLVLLLGAWNYWRMNKKINQSYGGVRK